MSGNGSTSLKLVSGEHPRQSRAAFARAAQGERRRRGETSCAHYGRQGRQLSGDGILESPGFVLISVALDTAALRAGSDSRTLTVSFPTPAISNKRCLTLSLIIRP